MNARSHIRTTGRGPAPFSRMAGPQRDGLPAAQVPAAQALGAYLGGMALTTTLALILAGAAAAILKHAL
ncbi:hypothetical protein SAMN05216304_108201 [Bosea sp. OK403]|uniref:hypothetical protein n=1 Tax=Bosea sp. OK403 TaxID=1855286 RepID=UPI0008E98244|nr:hypothetical protein [Bosea sp. OK403]SFJ47818.1 hypothetical protein SAMN05216304_108201 [Bosea sp. OK403]